MIGSALLAQIAWQDLAARPWFWALALGAIGLMGMIPRSRRATWRAGRILAVAGVVLLAGSLIATFPISPSYISQGVFWFLALLTVISAGAAVSMRNAVYCALWFALSLLGTGGLFLYQGAQFLGMATIVVYAGAIVVTFLYVVMLAQPEGYASYDRLSWSWYAKPWATIAAGWLLGVTIYLALALEPESVPLLATEAQLREGILTPSHVAGLGAKIFSRHLIAVEVAGTLLMVALVGAIAMLSQQSHGSSGEQSERDQEQGNA